MIRLEVIDLFPKQQRPEVFAQKLYYIEGRSGAGCVAGESGGMMVLEHGTG